MAVITAPSLAQAQILALLPHRPPMLLVDRVEHGTAEQLVAITQLTGDEFFFQGHFPERPVMPGVLLIEAMAQACLLLYAYNFEIESLFYLAKAKASFTHPVYPGDRLRIIARKTKYLKHAGIGCAEIHTDRGRCATAELSFSSARE